MTVLVGFGGHGQDINSFLPVGLIYDNDPAKGWRPIPLTPPRAGGEFVVGINDSRERERLACRLEAAGWRAFHDGIVIAPNAHIGPGVELGRHTHINFNAGLTRCTLGDFVTVGPGATICGDVTIGDRTMIGAGATICNLVTIGSDVTVGAGAVVLHDVADGATVVGVPARPL